MLTNNKSRRICLALAAIFSMSFHTIKSEEKDALVTAKEKVTRGFEAPSYDTNFPSQTLFSIADFGRTTKFVKQSVSLKMTRSADFQIETETTGSPLIKVQASTVIIDLNGFRLNKLDRDQYGINLDRGIGIEVGYSKDELAADPTLVQPQNVIIRNGVISNFDIGIVIHAGVKSVRMERLTISRSAVGIVCMGEYGKRVTSCSLDNVRVVGDNTDNQLRLQWCKDKFELSSGGELQGPGFGYGADVFMPLEYNPVSNVNDALVYSGVVMRHCSNMLMNNVGVNALGYDGLAHTVLPAGDASRSEPDKSSSNVSINGSEITGTATKSVTRGIIIDNCSTIFTNNTESSNHISAMSAYGIHVKDSSSCSFKNSVFSNNEITNIQNALSDPVYDFTAALSAERTAVTDAQTALEAAQDAVVTAAIKTQADAVVTAATAALASTVNPFQVSATLATQITAVDAAVLAAQTVGSTLAQDVEVVADMVDVQTALNTYKTAVDAVPVNHNFVTGSPNVATQRGSVSTDKGFLVAAKDTVGVDNTVKAEAEKMTTAATGYIDLALAPTTDIVASATTIGTQITDSTTARAAALVAANAAGSGTPNATDQAVLDAMDVVIATMGSLKDALYQNATTNLLATYDYLGAGYASTQYAALSDANDILQITKEVVSSTVKTESEKITDLYVPAALLNDDDPIATVSVVSQQITDTSAAKTAAQAAADVVKIPNTAADAALQPLMQDVIDALTAYKSALYALVGVGLHSRGMYLNNCDAMEFAHIVCNRNQADNNVKGIFFDTGNVIEMVDVMCDHNQVNGDNVGTIESMHFKDINTIILKEGTANYNLATESIKGIYLENVEVPTFEDVSASNNTVTTSADDDAVAYGIHAYLGCGYDFSNITANCNKAEGISKGIYFENTVSVELREAFANSNESTTSNCIGIDFKDCNSFYIKGMSASYNKAKTISHGIYMTNPNAFEIEDVIANHNYLADASGTIARGMYLGAPQSILMTDVSCSDNVGNTVAEGMRVENGSTVTVRDGIFSLNKSTVLAAGENTTAVTAGDVSKHASYNFPTGAAGAYVLNTKDCNFEDVFASKNTGPRAVGMFAKGCNNSSWRGCTTTFQEASGNFFINNPFATVTVTALPVPVDQAPTLFGGAPATGTVDLKAATGVFLNAVKNIKTDQWLLELAPNYTNDKDFAASSLILRAAMAQFRLFSTAIGLHLHDCSNCIVKDHFSTGNISSNDSAFGFACTGNNNGHIIDGGKFAGNEGWANSAKGAVVADKYSLLAIKPFWDAISSQPTVDFSIDGNYTSERASTKVVGLRTVDYQVVQMDAGFGGDVDYELVSPVGGMGCGIVLGDGAQNIEVRRTDCSNNKGHSGQAFGILQDVTSAALLQDNRLYQCDVNIVGICFGLAEMVAQSNSIHVGNILFANKIGDYLNSNYLVPFNPDDPFDLSFPLKTGYNGDVGNYANASPYDNIEIRFVHPAPDNQFMGNDVATSIGTPEWQIDRGSGVKMFDV